MRNTCAINKRLIVSKFSLKTFRFHVRSRLSIGAIDYNLEIKLNFRYQANVSDYIRYLKIFADASVKAQ